MGARARLVGRVGRVVWSSTGWGRGGEVERQSSSMEGLGGFNPEQGCLSVGRWARPVFPGGPWWSLVVPGGPWWSLVVPGGVGAVGAVS